MYFLLQTHSEFRYIQSVEVNQIFNSTNTMDVYVWEGSMEVQK